MALPQGTVTFLFTDIEGSTRLLARLGEAAYLELLAQHDDLIRSAVHQHGGVEVSTDGDSFFLAFAEAAPRRRRQRRGDDAGPTRGRGRDIVRRRGGGCPQR